MRHYGGKLRYLWLAGGITAVASLAGGVATASPAMASTVPGLTVYSSVPSPLPPNLPSVGGEAYAFRQFGDQVQFSGSARQLLSVTVTMSDWACENGHWYGTDASACTTTPGTGFSLPMTLNIYSVGTGNAVGPLLATDTQTFFIPYRPSDSANCSDHTAWYDTATATCYHGMDANVTFDFSAQSLTLPDKVIYGIAYNTTHYGYDPVGQSAACYTSSAGCGYDSLNIALAPQVYAGSQVVPGTVYQDSPYSSEYCDHGAAGAGAFRLDSATSNCWTGYVPAVEFRAANPPTSASQCKKGGWSGYTDTAGNLFKNQGDCVSYVETGGTNKAAG